MMDICPTTYLLNVMQNGNAFCKSLTETEGDFILWVKADNGKGIGYSIAYDSTIYTTWNTVRCPRCRDDTQSTILLTF